MQLKNLWRPLLLLGTVIAITLLAGKLGIKAQLITLTEWVKSLGALAPIAFTGIYVLATVAALPGFILTLAAGAILGPLWGCVAVSLGATIGAGLAFLIARYFARDAIANWIGKNERFRRLDELVAKNGDVVVLFVRLVPLFPFNLVNYGLGLTPVAFPTYLFWSWLGMLPGTILYVVGAGSITVALREGRVPWLLLAILAVVVVSITFLARGVKKRLKYEGPTAS